MREKGKTARFWKKLRESGKVKNFLVFLVFIAIAAVFWFIMAINDEVNEKINVRVEIVDKPDSVTFITLPPSQIQVVVKDKASHLLRHSFKKDLKISLNFHEFSKDNRFVATRGDLTSLLRGLFGNSVSVPSVSVDSITGIYTTNPGKRIPVQVIFDVSAVPGMVVGAKPNVSTSYVNVYSLNEMDSLKTVKTEKIVLHDLGKTTTVEAKLKPIAGARIIPDKIKVTFAVEQLVKKESTIAVTPDNIPIGKDILFFPAKVKVVYYVPMSMYSVEEKGIQVMASFKEAMETQSTKVGIWVDKVPSYVRNVELMTDSVEYTLVNIDN